MNAMFCVGHCVQTKKEICKKTSFFSERGRAMRDYLREQGRNSKYFQNAEHILQTAIRLFREKGYTETSIQDICREAAISRSTFYNIFSTKRDVLTYMYDRLNNEKNFRDYDPEEETDAFVILWNQYKRYLILADILGPKLMTSLMQLEMTESLGLYEAVRSRYEEWTAIVQQCLEQGIMEFEFEPGEMVDMVTHAVFQLVQDWCRANGDYSLQRKALRYLEMGYGVDPRYRRSDRYFRE